MLEILSKCVHKIQQTLCTSVKYGICGKISTGRSSSTRNGCTDLLKLFSVKVVIQMNSSCVMIVTTIQLDLSWKSVKYAQQKTEIF